MEVVNIAGVPGVFVACVFSAALRSDWNIVGSDAALLNVWWYRIDFTFVSSFSTISSGLNSLAAVTMQDIVLAKFPQMTERNATRLAKGLGLSNTLTFHLLKRCLILAWSFISVGICCRNSCGLCRPDDAVCCGSLSAWCCTSGIRRYLSILSLIYLITWIWKSVSPAVLH